MSVDLESIRRRVAAATTRVAFKGRTGHGGSPASERHFKPNQLEGILLASLTLYEQETAQAALAACEELICGDGTSTSNQRAIDLARAALSKVGRI